VEGAVGLAAAIDFITACGRENILAHEDELLRYAHEKLRSIEGLKLFGTAKNKASVISFLVQNTHPMDIGELLDKMGIAVRTGHHCAQPLMTFLNVQGLVRVSFAVYNQFEDIDSLTTALQKAIRMLT
jgi:cysteine desulfurase/selenocysteine lyase